MIDQDNPNIATEHYFTAFDGRYGAIEAGEYVGREKPAVNGTDLGALKMVTFCVLVLKDGTPVTGENICFTPQSFDAEFARKIARGNAVRRMNNRLALADTNKQEK